MVSNDIKITLRSLLKNKGYSLINILGLAIGLACFALITVYIQNEESYESFNPGRERIYRVIGILQAPGLGPYHNAVTPGLLGPTITGSLPQVESAVRLLPAFSLFVSRNGTGFYQDGMVYADPGVFDMFALEMVAGDRATALNEPRSVVLDEETAAKYFGTENPLGKQMMVTMQEGPEPFMVTGVMKPLPKNSHLAFSALMSMVTAEPRVPYLKQWGTNCLGTYLLLRPGVRREDVESQITPLVRSRMQDAGDTRQYYLQALGDIHLNSGHILYQTWNQNQGSATMLRMFVAIGVFVLLIASINYMNLATARSVQRAKEVGVRKVLGAGKRDLIARFVGESTVTALLGFLLSLAVVEMVYPWFSSVMGSRLVIDAHRSAWFVLELLLVALAVGVASGIYPAFVLSSYQPAETLRGKFTRGAGGARLRKALVIAQFSIAIVLLACTWIVRDQMQFVRSKDLGFEKSQLMHVSLRSRETHQAYPTLKAELLRSPAVEAVSAGGGIAGAGGSNGGVTVAGTNRQVRLMMRFTPVDFDFFTTMGLKLVAGRDFNPAIASDTARGVIINQMAAEKLGWKDPVGKQFEQDSVTFYTVLGVVNDYHFFSLYNKVEPQLIYVDRSTTRFMLVRLAPDQIEQGVKDVEAAWKRLMPAEPFVYGFVDQTFERMYRSDQNTQRLFAGFSIVAVLVGCLGLFGLSAFTAEQRTKEIGIRKTLGATTSSLVVRLSTEFVRLVALSCLLAFPVAYWVMQGWLESFAYRTTINPVSFLAAGGLVVVIAFITVSAQSMKAALANPVESLRYE